MMKKGIVSIVVSFALLFGMVGAIQADAAVKVTLKEYSNCK